MADKDFFLSSDDAQTMGDINYMKRSVRVRHTFPKTLKNPDGFAREREVSSSSGRSIDDFNSNNNNISITPGTSSSFQTTNNSEGNFNPKPINTTPKKRPQGNSMDMFRNMARNIGKK